MATALPVSAAPPPGPANRLRIGAWVLYDLANTVYAATLTFLFTPYAKGVLQGELTGIGLVQFGSMVLAGLMVPFLGALADQTARTRGYLALVTLLCIGATAAFAADFGGGVLLACFFVANVTYNFGLLFYNALLPSVADESSAGRVGGLGVGVGYLGTILVLAVLLPLPVAPGVRFLAAAALFLVLSLPCLLLVRDRRPPRPGGIRGALRRAGTSLWQTLHDLPRHRPLLLFLLGNFCLVDVLNTAILYFADFTTEVFADAVADGRAALFGWTFVGDAGRDTLLLVMGLSLNGLAMPFGVLLGRWADRAPLAAMRGSALALLGALVGGTVFGGHSVLGYLLTLSGLGAFGLAGIWTAGRQIVLRLSPPDRIGEYFGLYGITVKLSVVGSVVYAIVADTYGCKPAMLAQGVQLLLGLGCLAMVQLPRPRDATGQP